MDTFQHNSPPKWTEFCSHMFKDKTSTQLKINVVFQILNYILTDGKESILFYIMVARSKELVTALCQYGACVGYNTVKKIDVDLAEQFISTAGANRVPLLRVFEASAH